MRLRLFSGTVNYGSFKLGIWSHIMVRDQSEFWMLVSKGYKKSYYPLPYAGYYDHTSHFSMEVEMVGNEWKLKKEHPD